MLTITRSSATTGLALAVMLAVSAGLSVPALAGEVSFASPEAAYEQGLGAHRAGKSELAVSAFEFAANNNHVPALYFLATIYANNDERLTDHAKAFNLFHRIVERFAYVDPVSDYRSVFVVKAAVRLANYYRSGVPALGLKADPRAAVELLNHAATYFGDLEAQFQLAKMHLTGEGVEGNQRYGLHWLSTLARKNHPGAQAFLAELLWRGKFVQKDANKALAWSMLSLEQAGDRDRIWIEEIYQTIYCGAAQGVRESAGQLVADWRRRAPAATPAPAPVDGVDPTPGARNRQMAQSQVFLQPGGGTSGGDSAVVPTQRACANGEPVPSVSPGGGVEPMPRERTELPLPPIAAPIPVLERNAARGPVTEGAALPAAAPADKQPAGRSAFGQGFREFDKTEPPVRGRR